MLLSRLVMPILVFFGHYVYDVLLPDPRWVDTRIAISNAVLRPVGKIDFWFFNNIRAVRLFLLCCVPGLFLLLLSIFVPQATGYCAGALGLVAIGLGLAFVASRSQL